MTAQSPKDHFEKVLARLFEIVVLGKTHLKIGQGLRDTVMVDPAIANVSPVFWGTTMTAHLDVAQLAAFKLFDKRAGTMTIAYLLNIASQCSGSFGNATPSEVEQIIKNARAKILGVASSLKPLNAKRNRVLAHLDPTVVRDPQKLAQECRVKFVDLDILFKAAGGILNDLSVAYRDISSILELLDDDDFDHAVQLIADAKHDQAERFEREFGEKATFPRPKRSRSPLF